MSEFAGQQDEPRRGDLTRGHPLRTLIMFSLPQMIGNVMQSLNGSINAVWVGRLIGPNALAATAIANIIMFLMLALVFGFGMAATIRIGHAYGARDIDRARRAFGTAVGLTVIMSVVIALLGWLLAEDVLDLLATPPEIREEALAYLRVVFVSLPAGMVMIMLATGLRAIGDSRTPMVYMTITAVLSVALNPPLIVGFGPVPPLGIAGSAAATAIANLAALIGLVVTIYRRDLAVRLRGPELGYLIPRRSELGFILGKGVPMGAQMVMLSANGLIMIGLVNREGLVTAAAYGALLQIWNYMGMPAMAVGASASAMVAQHIGAAREDRVDAIARSAALANLIMTGSLTVLMLLFDRPAVELFLGPGSPSIEAAVHIQEIAIWAYLPFGITIVLFGALRAYGVVWSQLLVLLVSLYAIRLGFYYVFYPRIGADALWLSMVAGTAVSMVLALVVYRFGSWRRHMEARLSGLPYI